MLQARSYIVQTHDQYQFIYAAVVEQLLYGDTEFEADELDNLMEENLTVMPGGVNGFSHQVRTNYYFGLFIYSVVVFVYSKNAALMW